MKYKKIINLLDNTTNQSSKFRTKNWVEINDDSRETYIASNKIRFKILMLNSSLCDYSDAHIHIKGTITIYNTTVTGAAINKMSIFNVNKKVIFKTCAPFTNYITEINNTQVDDAKDIAVVTAMHKFIEYNDIYLKASGSLRQYDRDEPDLNNNNNIIDFPAITIVFRSNLKKK